MVRSSLSDPLVLFDTVPLANPGFAKQTGGAEVERRRREEIEAPRKVGSNAPLHNFLILDLKMSTFSALLA